MKKRLVTGSIILLSALLVGCSSSSKSAGTEGKTNIRFSTWDSEKDLDAQQALVDKFNESQEEIFVTLEAYGSEYDTKITAGMGAKDAPDVMYMWNFPQYYEALEPLNDLIANEGADYKDNFYETLWNYNSIEDSIYGIPVGFTTHVVYYNKDLFDANNVAYPEDGWTWEQLEATAQKLTNNAQNEVGYVVPGKPDPYDFEMFFWGNDTAFSDENGKIEGVLNNEKSIEVLDSFQKMLKEGTAIVSEGSGTTEMETNKVGMYVNGSWTIQTLQDSGINFGTVTIPGRNGNEGASILSSSGLAISKNSENKEAAFEFIKYWTSEEANESRIAYELPVLKSVVAKHDLENDAIKGPFYQMLLRSDAFVPSSFKVKNWSTVSADLELAFEQVFNPSSLENPKTALDSVVESNK
ncbi:MAG: extracellular solute-binding protein [Enterococcus lemanii]|jgi:multiple sugar transport system substrate-binding protein